MSGTACSLCRPLQPVPAPPASPVHADRCSRGRCSWYRCSRAWRAGDRCPCGRREGKIRQHPCLTPAGAPVPKPSLHAAHAEPGCAPCEAEGSGKPRGACRYRGTAGARGHRHLTAAWHKKGHKSQSQEQLELGAAFTVKAEARYLRLLLKPNVRFNKGDKSMSAALPLRAPCCQQCQHLLGTSPVNTLTWGQMWPQFLLALPPQSAGIRRDTDAEPLAPNTELLAPNTPQRTVSPQLPHSSRLALAPCLPQG